MPNGYEQPNAFCWWWPHHRSIVDSLFGKKHHRVRERMENTMLLLPNNGILVLNWNNCRNGCMRLHIIPLDGQINHFARIGTCENKHAAFMNRYDRIMAQQLRIACCRWQPFMPRLHFIFFKLVVKTNNSWQSTRKYSLFNTLWTVWKKGVSD